MSDENQSSREVTLGCLQLRAIVLGAEDDLIVSFPSTLTSARREAEKHRAPLEVEFGRSAFPVSAGGQHESSCKTQEEAQCPGIPSKWKHFASEAT